MVSANLGTAQAAEKALGLVGAGLPIGIAFAVIDPVSVIAGVKRIPMRRFICMNGGVWRYTGIDCCHALGFTLANKGQGAALAFAHHHNRLAKARLVDSQAPVAAVFFPVGGLHISAKIGTIDFHVAIEGKACRFPCHRFTQLVRQHKGGFVLHVQIATDLQRRYALRTVYENDDGREQVRE